MLNPWKRDVMPDKPPAHHGRGGTVGVGGNCAADTEVSEQSNVGRDETMVGSSKVVVGYKSTKFSCLTSTNLRSALRVLLAYVGYAILFGLRDVARRGISIL